MKKILQTDHISVSVIIVNWNGKRFLQDCFISLEKQVFQDFETILVDNGSSDGSIEFVKKHFPWVRVLSLDKNYGYSGGNNRGINMSKGTYIVLLNNDTEADPLWLEELVATIKKNPKVGFLASKVLFHEDRETIDAAGDSFTLGGHGFKIHNGQMDLKDNQSPKEVFGASGVAVLFRQDVFDRVGYFDEDFFAYCEDLDISFRARLAGFKCLYVPTAVVYHHVSGTTGKFSAQQFYLTNRNMLLTYLKNMPGRFIFRYFHCFLYAQVRTWGSAIIRRKGFAALKGKIDTLKMIPSILPKRKLIQKSRVVSDKYLIELMKENNKLTGWWVR